MYRSTPMLLCAALTVTGIACAQTTPVYPSKLIRIVTTAAGSANDWGSRVLAQELTVLDNQ